MGGGGKSRSYGLTGTGVTPFYENQIQPGLQPVQTQLFQQISEALRTGGVGAQIPVIQQAVSQAQAGLGTGLQQTENDLTRMGLAGTPYGQRILAGQRGQGLQQIAGIPTATAQQFIEQAPGITTGILQTMLGALAASGKQKSRSGPFAT